MPAALKSARASLPADFARAATAALSRIRFETANLVAAVNALRRVGEKNVGRLGWGKCCVLDF